MSKRHKLTIGDVIEIPTKKGFAYAQFSHAHVSYGALLRVFAHPYKSRPDDLDNVIAEHETFVTFFPLKAALNKNIFVVIANLPVPDFARKFPLFRSGIRDRTTAKVKNWWLWDGEKEWMVGDITPEQRKLPLRGIWNDTLLIERIESGWTPLKDNG